MAGGAGPHRSAGTLARRDQARFRRLAFLLGVLGVLLYAWLRAWPGPIVARDVDQHWLDEKAPLLRDGAALRQSFRPRHDGLAEVEFLLARYETEENDGVLHFRLLDEQGRLIVEERFDTASLTHNQTILLQFAPQSGSAGVTYTLEARGEGRGAFSLWGYTLDVYDDGEFVATGAATPVQELRFLTRYHLTRVSALSRAAAMLAGNAAPLLLALTFTLMPGALLLRLYRWRDERRARRGETKSPSAGIAPRDPVTWWGMALALGLSLSSLLWFWFSMAGGRWTGTLLWVLFGGGWLLSLALWRVQARGSGAGVALVSRRLSGAPALLLVVLGGGLIVRLLAVRDLLFPPWVDAVRHGLITTIMASTGQVLMTYGEWLPVDQFPYHYGFHTIPASLLLMTGWEVTRVLLLLGQLLNALVALSVYAAAYLMTRRREVGLVAAFLVAFPFLFPGYYATWGRYTQLAGMLIMPLLVAVTWLLIRGGRRWRGTWWLVALLASGLFLVHLRVFLYYLPFPCLVWAGARFRRARQAVAAGGMTILLVGWRAWQLFPRTSPVERLTEPREGYNDFPVGYVTAGLERLFIALALVALFVALPGWLRRRRRATLPLALGAWVGALFLLLGGRAVGLPESWLVNVNSMYITLFFPLALVLGILAERLWQWSGLLAARVPVERNPLQGARYAALGAVTTALLLFGAHHQVGILNEQTILAFPEERAALAWIDENLPEDACIAVSAWKWLGNTWAGNDGGAWLLPLTGRCASTPPADYVYNPEYAREVARFNEEAMAIQDWSGPEAAEWLRTWGITHLYVGKRGGFLRPAELARNPELELLYSQSGIFLFHLR